MSTSSLTSNRQQMLEEGNKKAINSRHFGDDLESTKGKKNLRFAFQNIRGFGTSHNHVRAVSIKHFIQDYSIDAMGMAEVNINWTNVGIKNTMEQICRTWFERTRTTTAYNTHYRDRGPHQPGGVAIISTGAMSDRAGKPTYDARYLGRWTSQVYQGKQGVTLRFVSVYVPLVAKEHGNKKIFCQQQDALLQMKVSGAVLTTFWLDFWEQVDAWLENGDQLIIGGDWNEDTLSEKFLKPFEDRHLIPVVQKRHGPNLPGTHNNGSKAIDEIFVSSTLQIIKAGYGEFGKTYGDHRPVWVEISIASALGTELAKIEKAHARRLKCRDPRIVQRYNTLLHKRLLKHGVYHRAHKLLQTFHSPLLPAEEQELEKLDRIRVSAMVYAEKHCRKLHMGKYKWSPVLQKARDKIKYMKLSLSRKNGSHVGARMLSRLSKRLGISVEHKSKSEITEELYKATVTYKKLRKSHETLRTTHLSDLAAALAKQNKAKYSSIVKQLHHLEEQRATFKRLKGINRKIQNLSLSYVTVTDEKGIKHDITDRTQMEQANITEIRKKYHQSEGACPFLEENLQQQFGTYGEGPQTESVLKGSYAPPADMSTITKDFLEVCKLPDEDIQTELPRTVADFKLSWKKMRESTATNSIHFGHFQAALSHQTICLLHYAMAEIPFRSGHTLDRWKNASNVMILKKEGITDIDRLRTIVLFEADFNHNNKFLGRKMMEHTNNHNLLAVEQYSTPGKKCIDHVINRRLTFDVVRYQKASLAVSAVDLKSCYDRIAHSPAYLAMRGFGIPAEPVKSMFNTYQNIKFHIKTSHGTSKQYFGGQENGFKAKPQGVGQGNGAGPPVWAVVSSRMFQILRKRNLVSTISRPISKEQLQLCGFAYVDDSDIIATSNNVNDPNATIMQMQQTLDTWEESAKVTGGALEPSKSFGFLVYFTWKNGVWSYGKVNDEHTISTLDQHGKRTPLTMMQPSQALNMLGVHLAPDGNETAQFQYMFKKALQLGEYMRIGFVRKEECWIALNIIATKVIEYPLPATTLSQQKLKDVMWQLLQTYLPKAGINRRIDRTVLYGEVKYQGLGLKDPYIYQGCKHIHDLSEHLFKKTITGQLFLTSLEHLRIELGLNIPILSSNISKYIPLLSTSSWITETWKFCSEQGIVFPDQTPTIPLLRKGDQCLMEILLNISSLSPDDIKAINRCRLYLRIFTISDLASGDGKIISYNAWSGIRFEPIGRDTTHWPLVGKPSPKDWTTWRTVLRNHICADRFNTLTQPLGGWLIDVPATWYMDLHTFQLWHNQDGEWTSYTLFSHRSRSKRYHLSTKVSAVPIVDHLRPTTVHSQKQFITMEGVTYSSTQVGISSVDSFPTWLFHSKYEKGSTEAIAAAIREGSAKAISDGSYKATMARGASASFLTNATTTDYIQVTSISPGTQDLQCAYRSELLGLLASLQLIADICVEYNINKGGCAVICDGKGALLKIFHETRDTLKLKTPHSDLISACVSLIEAIPVRLTPVHVAAHQNDHKAFLGLDDNAKLNVLADQHAKRALDGHTTPQSIVDMMQPHSLSFQQPVHAGIPVRYDVTSLLYSSIYQQKLSTTWIKEKRFLRKDFKEIDWNAQQKAINLTSPSRRRFVSKWALHCMGTGAKLVEWNLRRHGECPFCDHKQEDTLHILKCQHKEVCTNWEKLLQKYTRALKRIRTSPILIKVFVVETATWLASKPHTSTVSLTTTLANAITTQRRIGWKGFLEGLITKQFTQIQQSYLDSIKSRKTSLSWAASLITLNWSMIRDVWQFRNDKLHQTQVILDREGHKELLAAITQEWKIGLHRLPIRDFAYLFQMKFSKLQTRSTQYLKSWFVKVRGGRELHKDPKLLQDEFSEDGPLRKWVGLTSRRIEEAELEKALVKEIRIGISHLPEDTFGHLFNNTTETILQAAVEVQKDWLRTIRLGREQHNDPKTPIDRFSVEGPLRQWIGINK